MSTDLSLDQRDPPLHLFHAFSTFAVGGQQTRFISLANALGGRLKHSVLAMDGDTSASKGLTNASDWSIADMPVAKTSAISLANVRAGHRLLSRLRPDLLLSYNWGTIEWVLSNWPLKVCPHIHIEDGFGAGELPQFQNPRRILTRRLLLRHCALTIVPSKTLFEIAQSVWRLPKDRVLYLPNGIDCSRFASDYDRALATRLGLDDDHLVVGTVAALRPEKNLRRLLRIFARVPRAIKVKLAIVGDGPERNELERTAKELGISDRVMMVGPLAQPERLLKRFDIFALSSDTEQMPNSILEAMAAGRAIVSTDVGDVKQMVALENRPFVQPKDADRALAEALRQLLEEPALRERLGSLNESVVNSTYSLDVMVRRYAQIFSDYARR